LEEFDVLLVNYISHDQMFGWKLSEPILNVKINYREELISFHYELDVEKKWIFSGKAYLLSLLNNINDHNDNTLYHRIIMNQKRSNGTFHLFQENMNKLAPLVLTHPKVRIKSILYK